jgi:hypothetical protein
MEAAPSDQELYGAICRRIDHLKLLVDGVDNKKGERDDAGQQNGTEQPGTTRAQEVRTQRCNSPCNREARLHDRSPTVHRRKETYSEFRSRVQSRGMLH